MSEEMKWEPPNEEQANARIETRRGVERLLSVVLDLVEPGTFVEIHRNFDGNVVISFVDKFPVDDSSHDGEARHHGSGLTLHAALEGALEGARDRLYKVLERQAELAKKNEKDARHAHAALEILRKAAP